MERQSGGEVGGEKLPREPGASEIRIGVRCATEPVDDVPLASILNDALPGWTAAPLFADADGMWLVTGPAEERVGTPEYARRAHSLAQDLIDSGQVEHAEADVPSIVSSSTVENPEQVSLGLSDHPPGSEHARWARDAIRCDAAWAISPARGAGIRIAHPDTGYTLHPNLGADALDLTIDRDFLDGNDDALDPLLDPGSLPLPSSFPGHGTSTASVMVGRGNERDGIVGVAPGATVVPLRAVESVVQFFDSDVARAVEHARISGCHVASISVGGLGFFGLRAAIDRAVAAGMIVVAAAGNNVRVVVAPASYANCLAAAATGPEDLTWPLSSRGRTVDVSAPGWGVHVADFTWEDDIPTPRVARSSGSSYAATHLAGVAALWLAHHGADALRERYGARVQEVFLFLLRAAGSRVPEGWDADAYGAGIVDAGALLAAPLPAETELDGNTQRGVSPVTRLSAMVDADPSELARGLTRRLTIPEAEVDTVVGRFERELAFHLADSPAFTGELLARERVDGSATQAAWPDMRACSPQFASTFVTGCQGT
ncbi:S8 family peptidase [Mycetocola manganoxydans]|uniref:S8 family peptidase n=1 Tax=Mycetocola manganoxydans TaxID=699879 RepID=UPI0011C42D42|nr:S8 family serine peptidase [Mycetocola manganoxydans]